MFSFRSVLLITSLLGVACAAPPPGHGPPRKIVPGRAFDRFVSIWLENTDFADALADPNLAALAKQGILLDNYFALTHPSEPNYVAHVGGDYFGMNNDNLNDVPTNISSVADLLDDKGISWGEYQEDMPVSGFAGFQFLNPVTGANDYVRKHDPLIIFDNVANNPVRAAKIKNFTLFDIDLANNALPQWMFITPNMTDDGHDTNVTVAGAFSNRFLTPLLTNPNFNDKNTLILLTFDENDTGSDGNKVWSILLGNAVPAHLRGTTDSTFYTHYSAIASIEANWDLHHLGRYDVSANPFALVAERTGERLRPLPASVTAAGGPLLNGSYPGVFNSKVQAPLPIPNTRIVVNGRTILPSIRDVWGAEDLQRCTVYSDNNLVPPSLLDPPVLPQGC